MHRPHSDACRARNAMAFLMTAAGSYNSPQARRVNITKRIIDKFGPTEGCKKCATWTHLDLARVDNHSGACRARVEALMAADPEFRCRYPPGRFRAQPDRGAESLEEQGTPSPPDATAAAGSSAVPVNGEGGTAEDEARGIALRLVKLEPTG